MFLMTFDLRYQSGAHWGLKGVPYCVSLIRKHKPWQKTREIAQTDSKLSERIIDTNLLFPVLSENETRFWTIQQLKKCFVGKEMKASVI